MKLTIKTNITKSMKSIDDLKKRTSQATIESMGVMAKETFKLVEDKYISSQEYEKSGIYTTPPTADLPKTIKKKGRISLTKSSFFSSKTITSRSGELLDSIKKMLSYTYNRLGRFSSEDYEVIITKNRMVIKGSDKAAVLERKRTPISPARKFVTKSARKVITTWKKAWKRVFK